MWDLNPEAPEEIRGTFRPIATNAAPAGIDVSEAHALHAARAGRQVRDRPPWGPPSAEQPDPAAAYWMMIVQPDRLAIERSRRE